MEIFKFSYSLLLLFNVLVSGSVSNELEKMSSELLVNSAPVSKSLSQYARLKIANLHSMKEQLEKIRLGSPKILSVNDSKSIFINNSLILKNSDMANSTGIKYFKSQNPFVLEKVAPEIAVKIVSANLPRNAFLSKLLPKTDILKKLAKMRETLEPNLRTFLTSKYNDFLTNLVPYSDTIGVPPFMLNSMKIPENFDPRWNYIQNLLETTPSLEQFLNTLPEISSLTSYTSSTNEARLSHANQVQSRSDDDFISDQEPQATSKGKKKYGTFRLPTRVKVYRKGDSAMPERGSYEYAGVGDQYGLYSHNTYDTSYGKGYDDYSVAKGSSSDDYPSKGGKGVSKHGGGAVHYGETFASGHNSYSTHGSGGYGGGSYTSNLGGYLDPFSVLGSLAFLVYLGLLFQQSLNMTSGRSFSDSIFTNRFDKPVELKLLNFDSNFDGKTLDFSFRNRKGRSQYNNDETLEEAVILIQALWKDIQSLKYIINIDCRHQKLCQIIRNMENPNLLPVFIEALEKEEEDKTFLYDIVNQIHDNGIYFDCKMKLRCDGNNNK